MYLTFHQIITTIQIVAINHYTVKNKILIQILLIQIAIHFDSLPIINNSQILETMVTVPIRSDSVQYDTLPPLLSPDTAHNRTVPDVAYTVLDSTDIV